MKYSTSRPIKWFAFSLLWYLLVNNAYSVNTPFDEIFINLDTTRISSGVLYSPDLPQLTLMNFDGENDSIESTKFNWHKAYYEWYNLTVTTPSIPDLGSVKTTIKTAINNKKIPLGILYVNYNLIRSNALLDSLLVLVDGRYYDGPNRSQSPYTQHRSFIATSMVSKVNSLNVTYDLSNCFFFTNASDEILHYSIDFDDGNGSVLIAANDEVCVNYESEGKKILRVAAYTENGDTLKCLSSIVVRSPLDSNMEETHYNSESSITLTENSFTSSTIHSGPIPENCDTGEIITGVYDQKTFSGHFGIWYGCNSESQIKKPLIFVEGFDPGNSNTINGLGVDENALYEIANQENFCVDLQLEGYDIIILDFDKGGDSIQGNAMVLKSLIDTINSRKKGDNELVIVGASMGGLVAKYALSYMEDNNKNHQTRLFISLDSPHQGAYVSLGLQFLAERIDTAYNNQGFGIILGDDSYERIKESFDKVNCTAARQMLVFHHESSLNGYGYPDPLRTQLLADSSFRLPRKCRNIALACGSGNSVSQGFPSWYCQVGIDTTIQNEVSDAEVLLSLHALDSLPGSFQHFERIFVLFLDFRLTNWFWNWWYSFSSLKNQARVIWNAKPYDNCPGGSLSFIKSLYDGLNDAGFLSGEYPYSESFIPTISALDIQTVNLFYNVYVNITSGQESIEINNKNITPFAAFYVGNENLQHIIGGIKPRMKEWMFNQIVKDTIEFIDSTFSNVKVQYEAKKIILAGSENGLTSICDSASITFVAGESIILKPGFKVVSGSSFRAYITSYNCGISSSSFNFSETPLLRSAVYQEVVNNTNQTKSNQSGVVVSPNPTNGFININTILKENDKGIVYIFDSMGKLIYKDEIIGSKKGLFLDTSPGIYFLKIELNNINVYTKKIIVK